MSITILRPGLLTSIQDMGRYGFQKYGVIVGGAMDTCSLRIANLLVGNQEGEAALEITLVGPTLSYDQNMLVAITGGGLSPTIEGVPVPLWQPVYVKKGSVLRFGANKSGCRAYVAVAGGFDIPEIMESKSTYLRGEIGGYKGRALQEGDVLAIGTMSKRSVDLFEQLQRKTSDAPFSTVNWLADSRSFLQIPKEPVIRVLPGGQFDRFTSFSKEQFFTQPFKITPQSDRMGYRISGPAIELEEKVDMLSEAVSYGTIQIPPDGNPIILLADRQTTGGYPKIAQVITVDLSVIAQLKPGETIRFTPVTLEEAEKLYIEREQKLKELEVAIGFKCQAKINI